MPPCAWIALAVTSRPPSAAAAAASAAASGRRSGSASAAQAAKYAVERARLGAQEHLRAAVRDGLEGADRHAELLAVLDVLERHVERALADADDLGRDRGADAVGGARAERLAVAAGHARRSGASGRSRRAARPSAPVDRAPRRRRRAARARRRPRRRRTARACRRRRSPRRTRGRAGARALLVGAAGLDHGGGDGGREERRRRARVAELLEQHGQLDGAEALAAVLLGDRDARPAELDELAPQRVVVRRAPRRPRAPSPTASAPPAARARRA